MTSSAAATPALLGIDLGTSSVKAVVADLEGAVIGQAAGDYPVINDRPGWAETDPADWFRATVSQHTERHRRFVRKLRALRATDLEPTESSCVLDPGTVVSSGV